MSIFGEHRSRFETCLSQIEAQGRIEAKEFNTLDRIADILFSPTIYGVEVTYEEGAVTLRTYAGRSEAWLFGVLAALGIAGATGFVFMEASVGSIGFLAVMLLTFFALTAIFRAGGACMHLRYKKLVLAALSKID